MEQILKITIEQCRSRNELELRIEANTVSTDTSTLTLLPAVLLGNVVHLIKDKP